MKTSILFASTILLEVAMPEIHKAKIFKNGGSQAIRIPAQWRFSVDEVYLRFDSDRNELIISERNPKPMARFFEALGKYGPVSDEEWPDLAEVPESPRPGWEALIELED